MSLLRVLSLALALSIVCPLGAAECERAFATPLRYGTGAEVHDLEAAVQLERQVLILRAGEYTGDQKTDLAFIDRTNGALLPGDGTFAAPVPSGTSLGSSLVTGDLNGDGNLDVAHVHGLELGDGKGGFTHVASSLFVGDSIVVADFNRDGRDVVVFNSGELQWFDGSNPAAPVLIASGVDSLSLAYTTTLAPGLYVFWAVYSGEEQYVRADVAPVTHAIPNATAPSRRRAARH